MMPKLRMMPELRFAWSGLLLHFGGQCPQLLVDVGSAADEPFVLAVSMPGDLVLVLE